MLLFALSSGFVTVSAAIVWLGWFGFHNYVFSIKFVYISDMSRQILNESKRPLSSNVVRTTESPTKEQPSLLSK